MGGTARRTATARSVERERLGGSRPGNRHTGDAVPVDIRDLCAAALGSPMRLGRSRTPVKDTSASRRSRAVEASDHGEMFVSGARDRGDRDAAVQGHEAPVVGDCQ